MTQTQKKSLFSLFGLICLFSIYSMQVNGNIALPVIYSIALVLIFYFTQEIDPWHRFVHILLFCTAFTLRFPINLPIGYVYGADILIVGILIYMIVKLEKSIEIFHEQKLVIAFLGYLIFHTAFIAYDKIEALKQVIIWFKALTLFLFIYKFFPYKKYIKEFFKIWNVFLIFQLIVSFAQKVKGGNVGLSFLGESESVFRGSMSGYSSGISGTFGHPSLFAYYTLMVLCWGLFAKDSFSRGSRNLLIALSVIIVVLSASRTAMGLLMLIFFIYILVNFDAVIKNEKTIFVIILFTTVGIILSLGLLSVIQPVLERMLSAFSEGSFDNRIIHIQVTWEFILQRPILGWGLGNYTPAINTQYDLSLVTDPEMRFVIQNRVHNIYMLYALELGISGGLFIFCAFFLSRIIKQIVALIKTRCRSANTIAFGAAISMLILLIYGIQGQSCATPRAMYLLWIGVGLYENHLREIRNNEQNDFT